MTFCLSTSVYCSYCKAIVLNSPNRILIKLSSYSVEESQPYSYDITGRVSKWMLGKHLQYTLKIN